MNLFGYTNNKSNLQDRINEYIKNGDGNNIAFVQIDTLPEYQLCLLKKDNETNDEEIFEKIKNAGTTYYNYYAVTDSAVEKAYVATKEDAEKTIEELKEKNSELEQSLRELENIKTENNTLKEYLNLTEKYGEYKTVPGYVINKDISNYSKTIVINIGKEDGVEENMTVIADQGLVGHVISVTENTAKIQTIIDTASSVSCTMSDKDTIVCKGTLDDNTTLKAMYIPTEANVIQGDSIETSGLGGIYPKGIHVGTIQKVENTQNITDRYALVETAVDFNKLDTVLVIVNQ